MLFVCVVNAVPVALVFASPSFRRCKQALTYSFDEQLGFPQLPEQPPTKEELQGDEKMMKDLHHLLLETQISEGKLVCGNCGHEYAIKEGIANFLLPSHLV
jgi:uncharacterized protein YbaR (Trm112 family)